jgi:type 1 glutamine amidotransferase
MPVNQTRARPILKIAMAWMCMVLFSPAFALEDAGPKKATKAHIVFLISEDPDNYEAHKTVPVFAEQLRQKHNFQVTVLLGNGPREGFHFSGLDVLLKADLLIVFCRRVALSHKQLQLVKKYLEAGKPIIGLRTANHAFSVRGKVQDGYEAWPDFVPKILGCENRGYGPTAPGTEVSVVSNANNHPILKEVEPRKWHSNGNVYRVSPLLDERATVLLTGKAEGTVEPIAWTRTTPDNSRVFYTSLGYPDDFNDAPFRKLLVNGIYWALEMKP